MELLRKIKSKYSAQEFYAIGRVIREFKPHRAQVAWVLFLGLVIAATQPIAVKLVNRIVDELQKGPAMDPKFFQWVPVSLILIFLVSGFAKYFHNTLRRNVTERVIIRLRGALFQKYLVLPLSFLDKKRAGDLLSNIQTDLQQISSGVDTLCLTLKEPFTFAGLMAVAFYCDWQLTLSTIVVAPIVALLFSRSGSAVKRYARRGLENFSDLMSIGQESLTGARVVKVFALEEPLMKRFTSIQDKYFRTVWKSIKVEELATPLVEFIGALLMAGVILYGGYRASHGTLTSGQLVAFVVALGLAQMPIKQLNNAYLKLKSAEAAAERIYAILDTPETQTQIVGRFRKKDLTTGIEFKNVSLVYDQNAALSDVSFTVGKGQCVALVGPSGSGKTSIVNCLPRLYEISDGQILIDGIPHYDIYLSDLRGLFSFVTQDTFLFNDSILENIRFGNPNASEEAIRRAASLAHCSEFIEKLPRGFDTTIGDRGMCLSGGERQRLAIARAFLKGSPILVLDEATSSLDSKSESVVQEALEELMVGRTTFMVAHRLSTVRKADRILVIEDGKIQDMGTHSDLMQKKGVYANLYERQVLPGII